MINYEAFFKVSYGLYIVTSGNSNRANGFISNAVFQVTSEPAQFAVCCNKNNYSAEIIQNTKALAFSILKQDASSEVIGTFGYRSGRDFNKMENVKIIKGSTGVPIVTNDSVAYIECEVKQTFNAGTHLIFICEVVSADVLTDEEPITYAYFRNVKKGAAPKNAPTYIDKSKLEKKKTKVESDKYRCPACGYIYDPEIGDTEADIPAGTKFKDLPDNWVCPLCGTEKEDFVKITG